jgi:hypothetical protein
MAGADGIRMTCEFDNPLDDWIRFGGEGGEMCIFLAYIDTQNRFLGESKTNEAMGEDPQGVRLNRAPCYLELLPPL